VTSLLEVVWENGGIAKGTLLPSIEEIRGRVAVEVQMLRNDHKRHLNPTPYKVSVSNKLYSELHKVWLKQEPIGELK
jgi:nicotinate phosphoribosyltransferase